jgi:hypothetical protein
MGKKSQRKAYTSRLQKGGALLEDMRLLVRSWHDGGQAGQRERIIAENVLSKRTRARAQDVYQEAFVPRFIKGNPSKAWKIVRALEDQELSLEILKPIYYWITARSDPLLYGFVADEILAKSKSHDLSIRIDETKTWIKGKLTAQDQSWSQAVTIRVAQGLLAALRDFGILEGATKKRIAPVYLPIESFAYLAFCLYELGSSGERLIQHRDWRLFLMEPRAIDRLFLDAHQNRLLHYEAAGKIYRIEFFAQNTEEMANVIAGRRD